MDLTQRPLDLRTELAPQNHIEKIHPKLLRILGLVLVYLILGPPRRPEVSNPLAQGGGDFVLCGTFVGGDAVVDGIDLLQEVFVDLEVDDQRIKKNVFVIMLGSNQLVAIARWVRTTLALCSLTKKGTRKQNIESITGKAVTTRVEPGGAG